MYVYISSYVNILIYILTLALDAKFNEICNKKKLSELIIKDEYDQEYVIILYLSYYYSLDSLRLRGLRGLDTYVL